MSGWPTVALGELTDLQAGAGFPPSLQGRLEGELPFAKVGDISRAVRAGGTGLIGPLNHVTRAEASVLRARVFPPGSTVFAKIGEAIAQNYRLFTDREAVFDNNVMGAIPNRDRVLPRYLFRFLETVDLYSYASKTAVPALRKSDLEQIQVPLPDKSIQQRIAAILDKADAIRRKRQETIALTDELLRSTFLEMFGDPMMNPKGWPMMTIGEIASKSGQIVDGPFGSTLKPDCYVSDGVRVIRNFNIHDGCFDDSDFRHVTHEKFEEIRRSEARPGDLLISTKGTVGDVCRMPELRGESVLSATGTVRIRIESAEWDPDFIVHQMIVPSYKAYIQRRQAGSIQKYLNLSGIREFVLFKPPVELQRSFAEFAERNRQLHARLALHQRGSEELFDSLVQRAFRGEL